MQNIAKIFGIVAIVAGVSLAEASPSGYSKERFYAQTPERLTSLVGLDADSWGVFEVNVDLGSIGTFKAQVMSLGAGNGYPRWSHSAVFSVDTSAEGVVSDETSVSLHFEGAGARRFYKALTRLEPRGGERMKEFETDQFSVSCLPTVCDVWMKQGYGVR